MANTFKNFLSNDIAQARTLLHEAIPITGSIISGTYDDSSTKLLGSENNIKTYGHGMFESIYDYPYLSSSANHIFDMTFGYHAESNMSASGNTQNAKKINIYNQMAQQLVGYDATGSIKKFVLPSNSKKMEEVFFIPFSRLLTKDEVKKGSFALELGIDDGFDHGQLCFDMRVKLSDLSGATGYHVDSPVGEYGELFLETTNDGAGALSANLVQGEVITDAASVGSSKPACGLIYYQAGIIAITGGVFNGFLSGGLLHDANCGTTNLGDGDGTVVAAQTVGATGFQMASGSTIAEVSNAIRNRIWNISFNNTTELNSTIYFCRVNHNDFNYSSNPTYLSGSRLRVKTRSADSPVSYCTTIGLYSADNELLATAKLSEPLRKSPDTEFTLRVRLDY
jgi:hypothetical protein